MPLKLLRVVPTPGLSKKHAAVFVLPNGRQRTVRFGTASNYVSNPRKTARDRAAYIARHHVNENHNDPLTPGALSRWLLWGESRSLARNTRRGTGSPQPPPAPQPAHRFSLRSPQDGSIFCLGSPRRPTSTSLARFPRRPEHGTARARLLARAPSSKSRRAFVGKTSDATLLSSRGG